MLKYYSEPLQKGIFYSDLEQLRSSKMTEPNRSFCLPLSHGEQLFPDLSVTVTPRPCCSRSRLAPTLQCAPARQSTPTSFPRVTAHPCPGLLPKHPPSLAFSVGLTEPSTVSLTPPSESASCLHSESSPEVPFAQFLSPSFQTY